jgi:hypothetical protein
MFIDKTKIREILARHHAEQGIVLDPAMTPAKLRQNMIDHGVRPEDNLASCGIIAARNEE